MTVYVSFQLIMQQPVAMRTVHRVCFHLSIISQHAMDVSSIATVIQSTGALQHLTMTMMGYGESVPLRPRQSNHVLPLVRNNKGN